MSENDKSTSGKWTEIDQSEIDPRRRKFMDEVVRPVGLSWLNCNMFREITAIGERVEKKLEENLSLTFDFEGIRLQH